jgi:hypothetical protein
VAGGHLDRGAPIIALLVAAGCSFLSPYPVDRSHPGFSACGGDATGVIAAFPISRARDFWKHFPAAGKAPELEVDDPAFIVVYDGIHEFAHMGNPRAETAAPRQSRAGLTDLCVFVGGSTNVYTDVSTVGFSPWE